MYRNSIWNSLRWGEISPEVHCTLIIFLYFILITLQCHPHVVKPEMMELTNQVHHHYDLWLTDSETLWTSCSTPHSCSMRLSSIGLPKLKKQQKKQHLTNPPIAQLLLWESLLICYHWQAGTTLWHAAGNKNQRTQDHRHPQATYSVTFITWLSTNIHCLCSLFSSAS